MGDLFVFLYPLVGLVSILAYVPQIKSLITTKSDCKDISLSSWLMWIVTGSIGFGYGVFHLQDVMFSITAGLNLGLVIAVSSLIIYNRYFRSGEPNIMVMEAAE